MITLDKNDQVSGLYTKLFQKASDLLSTEGNPVVINTLDDYFLKFGDITAKLRDQEGNFDESYYLLPFDEPPFEIDANTREIKVPESFKKGAAVQTDHASEIIVFTIDRYFDYMDFSDTSIQIRYTTTQNKEYAYDVKFKDLETYPGKVRFGWILGRDATAVAGSLKFAVRFSKDGNYLWNTKTQSINVYPVLQIGEAQVDRVESESIFSQIVTNSLDKGALPASIPSFTDPLATDLVSTADLGSDNTLTLDVLATKRDRGLLDYTWYYNDTRIIDGNVYGISDYYEEITDTKELDTKYISRDYYVKDEEGDTYSLYTGTFPIADTTTVYKKMNRCTIKDTNTEITGTYRVGVINTLNAGNYSARINSSNCILAGPKELMITEDLSLEDHHLVIVEEREAPVQYFTEETLTTTVYTANPLTIAFKADPGAFYAYSWKKDGVEVDSISFTDGATVPENGIVEISYTPEKENLKDVVGFYTVEVNTKKNRTPFGVQTSAQTRITDYPRVPELATTDDIIRPEVGEDGCYHLIVTVNNIAAINAAENSVRVEGEGLVYEWYASPDLDNNTADDVKITEKDSYVKSGLGTAELVLDPSKIGKIPQAVKCKVYNTLNGRESEVVESALFVVVSL